MANEMKKVKFPISQPIEGLGMIKVMDTELFMEKPTRIVKVSDNEVKAYYGDYVQTITADGEGNERYNFKSVIEKA